MPQINVFSDGRVAFKFIKTKKKKKELIKFLYKDLFSLQKKSFKDLKNLDNQTRYRKKYF
jgi:hypothetical protein